MVEIGKMFGSATQVHKINTRQDYDRVTTTETRKAHSNGFFIQEYH